jgi:hypothetical protein
MQKEKYKCFKYVTKNNRRQDSTVGTAIGHRLDVKGSIPSRARDYSLFHSVQIRSVAHSASYSVGTRGSFSRVKWSGREVDHSPQSNAEVKNDWVIPHSPTCWCLINYAQGKLCLYLYYEQSQISAKWPKTIEHKQNKKKFTNQIVYFFITYFMIMLYNSPEGHIL